MRNTSRGFTLIELIIVIAIVGVIVGIAIPQYADYSNKSKFSEVIAQTASAKLTVSLCIQETAIIDMCNGTGLATDYIGMYRNVPSPGIGHLMSLNINRGVITAIASQNLGSSTYILEPSLEDGILKWSVNENSTCISTGYCRAP